MRNVFDIMHDEDDDILITGGDLVRSESTQQHQKVLMLVEQGELKHAPLTGIGAAKFILDDDTDSLQLQHLIEEQYKRDGLQINALNITDLNNAKIKANYV